MDGQSSPVRAIGLNTGILFPRQHEGPGSVAAYHPGLSFSPGGADSLGPGFKSRPGRHSFIILLRAKAQSHDHDHSQAHQGDDGQDRRPIL
jgi:hypothetical protein